MAGFVEETPDSFIVELPNGKRMPVAKAGLSSDTVENYRSQLQAPVEKLPPAPPTSGSPLDTTQYLASMVAPSVVSPPEKPAPVVNGGLVLQPQPQQAGAPAPTKPVKPEDYYQPQPATGGSGMATGVEQRSIPVQPTGGQGMPGAGMLNQGFAMQRRGVAEGLAAGQARAAEEAGYRDEAFKQQVTLDAKQQELVGQYQRDRQGQMQKLQGLVAQLGDDSQKVDPDRWWNSRDTGQKLFAAIGVALGSLGGNGAHAMDFINKEVDRDIAAQQANLDRKDKRLGMAVSAQSNLVGLMRDNFKDDILANSAAKAALFEQVKSKVEGIASKYESPQLKANADKFLGDLSVKQGEAINQFNQRAEELALKRADVQLEQLKVMGTLMQKGAGGRELPAGEAKEIGGLDAAGKAVDDLWKAWQAKTGPLSGIAQHLPMTDAAEYTDQQKVAAQVIGKILEGGKLTDSDYQRYQNMLPTPGDSRERAALKVKAMQALLKRAKEGQVQGLAKAGFGMGAYQTPTLSTFRKDE